MACKAQEMLSQPADILQMKLQIAPGQINLKADKRELGCIMCISGNSYPYGSYNTA